MTGMENYVMTTPLRTIGLALAVVVLAVSTGCAKRPLVTAASAPAPTGALAVTPPPAAPPVAVAPSPPPAVVTPAAPPPPAAEAPRPEPVAPPVVAARPEPPKEFVANDNVQPIHFDFDTSNIRPADAQILEANARWLLNNPGNLVLVEGHCDQRGTDEYNLALGDRRARAAMNFLVAQGVPQNRISFVSYGEERPLCTEQNEACWSRNRRAMFLTKEQ
jgi:peptidoglycan-associated lipoprotein